MLTRPFSWKKIFENAMTRPFKLFALEPIVQLLGVYMAFIYGVFYRTFSLTKFESLLLMIFVVSSVFDDDSCHLP